MNIPGFGGMRIGAVLLASAKNFFNDDMATYASALAYQILFSLFPLFIFLIALVGAFHLPDFMPWLQEQAALFLPAQALEQLNTVLEQLRQPPGGLISAGAVLALWTASAGMRATMNAFNVAYRVKENRPVWILYPLSVFYTLTVAALLIASAALLLIGPQAVEWLAAWTGRSEMLATVWAWLRWPMAVTLMSLCAALVYYSAPAAQPRFPYVTPGAVLAVLIWIIASLGFELYVSNFADYNATYGSLGSVVLLLLYFYISAAVLLYGAEVNAVITRREGEQKTLQGGAEPDPALRSAGQA